MVLSDGALMDVRGCTVKAGCLMRVDVEVHASLVDRYDLRGMFDQCLTSV
jgi:hypothetical protein